VTQESSQSGNTITKVHPSSHPVIEKSTRFLVFEAHREGMAPSEQTQGCCIATRHRQRGRLVTVTPASHAVTRVPAPHTDSGPPRGQLNARPQPQHISCAPPFLCRAFSDSESPRPSNARVTSAVLRSYTSDDEERRYLSAWITPPANLPLQSHLSDSPLPLGCPTCEYPSCVWLLTAG